MKTNRADYKFIVKELPEGNFSVWALECYPQTNQFSCISSKGCMYIRLNSTASEKNANEIYALLNKHVTDFTIV